MDASDAGQIDLYLANTILTEQSLIANNDKELTVLLSKTAEAVTSADSQRIQALLTQIRTSGSRMISSGALGIKNAKMQKTVADSANLILSFASNIVATLNAAGLVK